MTILLFHGDNTLEIDEAVCTVRARFESADVLTLNGRDVPLPQLSEACLTAGLFDPERLVVVHDLHQRSKSTRKEAGDSEAIRQILLSVPDTTTVLLLCRDAAGDQQLTNTVEAVGGEVRSFSTPRKYDLPRWIMARAGKHDVTIHPTAAELLAELVGANPLQLESELEKLATYAGEEKRITPPMVEMLVGTVTQDSVFALVDAVAGGDESKALQLLHAQLERATSGPIDVALYLIRMLARQIRILLRIRLAREAGTPTKQITEDLKLSRYYAERYFRQANRLSNERLIGAFEQLAALEHALKSGRGDPGTGLDLLVADLCA